MTTKSRSQEETGAKCKVCLTMDATMRAGFDAYLRKMTQHMGVEPAIVRWMAENPMSTFRMTALRTHTTQCLGLRGKAGPKTGFTQLLLASVPPDDAARAIMAREMSEAAIREEERRKTLKRLEEIAAALPDGGLSFAMITAVACDQIALLQQLCSDPATPPIYRVTLLDFLKFAQGLLGKTGGSREKVRAFTETLKELSSTTGSGTRRRVTLEVEEDRSEESGSEAAPSPPPPAIEGAYRIIRRGEEIEGDREPESPISSVIGRGDVSRVAVQVAPKEAPKDPKGPGRRRFTQAEGVELEPPD